MLPAPPKFMAVLVKWLELLTANTASSSPVVGTLLTWIKAECRQSVRPPRLAHP